MLDFLFAAERGILEYGTLISLGAAFGIIAWGFVTLQFTFIFWLLAYMVTLPLTFSLMMYSTAYQVYSSCGDPESISVIFRVLFGARYGCVTQITFPRDPDIQALQLMIIPKTSFSFWGIWLSAFLVGTLPIAVGGALKRWDKTNIVSRIYAIIDAVFGAGMTALMVILFVTAFPLVQPSFARVEPTSWPGLLTSLVLGFILVYDASLKNFIGDLAWPLKLLLSRSR